MAQNDEFSIYTCGLILDVSLSLLGPPLVCYNQFNAKVLAMTISDPLS